MKNKKKKIKLLKGAISELALIAGAINIGASLKYGLSIYIGIVLIILAVYLKYSDSEK